MTMEEYSRKISSKSGLADPSWLNSGIVAIDILVLKPLDVGCPVCYGVLRRKISRQQLAVERRGGAGQQMSSLANTARLRRSVASRLFLNGTSTPPRLRRNA
jgi:hypothetical protein